MERAGRAAVAHTEGTELPNAAPPGSGLLKRKQTRAKYEGPDQQADKGVARP